MEFSNEEIRRIFDESQVEEQTSSETYEARYRDFYDKLTYVAAHFHDAQEGDYLFGDTGRFSPVEAPFAGLFNPIRHRFAHLTEDALLMEGVFSDWEGAFYSVISEIFGMAGFEQAEALVGTMTSPTTAWLEEKVMPAVREGRVLKAFAARYPIALRQLVTLIWQQIDQLEEILQVLKEELAPVYRRLVWDEEMPRIARVTAFGSDRHNGGRSVHMIIFENGRRVVYKPHHAAIDRAFRKWMAFMAEKADERPFVLPEAVDTKRGSFVTFVQDKPLERQEDAAEYFRRMGFLMGVVYTLNGNDLHAENIMAVGKEPVIIDLETMIAPKGCLVDRLGNGKSRYSVMNMTLLPTTMGLPGLRIVPYAGLCDRPAGCANLPMWEDSSISGRDYPEEICRGFGLALRTLIRHRDEAGRYLAEIFEGCVVRMVLRPTYFYVRLLKGLATPGVLENVERYQALIKRKCFYENPLLSQAECERLMGEEAIALDQLDVPFFEDIITEPMLTDTAGRWQALDEAKVAEEEARIRYSLANVAIDAGASEPGGEVPSAIDRDGVARLAARCLGLLDRSLDSALVTKEQSGYVFSNVPISTYVLLEGNLGTLLALGAYRLVFGSDEALDQAISQVLEYVIDSVFAAPALLAPELGLADGAAGYLVGCQMGYEMGLFSEEQLREAIRNLGEIAGDPLRLKFSAPSVLYGNISMLYAVNRLSAEFVTDRLLELKDRALTAVQAWTTYQDADEASLIRLVDEDMMHCPALTEAMGAEARLALLEPCRHNGLRFGNAGKLYRATAYLQQQEDAAVTEKAEALCRYLSARSQVVEMADLPAPCAEIGLFHGVPGMLYSICRYLRPDLVPSL
ncbi:MAG: DUF4135 domain-containing protein [Lachnospiraceae bacterium]|nr:DUF4135 domain-containing protein [Lachnospiraceae bacterium]